MLITRIDGDVLKEYNAFCESQKNECHIWELPKLLNDDIVNSIIGFLKQFEIEINLSVVWGNMKGEVKAKNKTIVSIMVTDESISSKELTCMLLECAMNTLKGIKIC